MRLRRSLVIVHSGGCGKLTTGLTSHRYVEDEGTIFHKASLPSSYVYISFQDVSKTNEVGGITNVLCASLQLEGLSAA